MSDFPYPGLRPYERDETDIFFGREEHTDQLIQRLGNSHFLAVVGPSGCGKSSLVRTGLLAALEAGFMAGACGSWKVAELRPGNRPFRRLTETFLENKILGDTATIIDEATISLLQPSLRRGPKSIHELLANTPLPDDTSLLILVDQFEEIFRYYQHGDKNDAAAFVKLLLASSTHPALYVIITMRSDFLGDCATFYGLPEAINQGLFLTPRLTREQLRDAIEMPAAVFGDEVEPALVNHLLNEVGTDPDKLPQLQHALMRMWRLAHFENPNRAILSLTHYEQIGELENALSQHANVAYAGLNSTQQEIAEILFRSLTERSNGHRDTRRPVKLSAVASLANVSWQKVVAVIEVFRQDGRSFLTPPRDQVLEPKTILDISHESLIRQWQRLRKWTKEEAISADAYRRLETTALLKEEGQAELWKGLDLANALNWYHSEKPNLIWAKRYGKNQGQYFELAMRFLTQSDAEEKREEQKKETARKRELQQARQNMTMIGVGFIVSIFLTVLAVWFGIMAYQAKNQAQQHRSLLLVELAQNETEEGNVANGLLFALEALPKDMSAPEIPYLPKAEEKLYEAVLKLRERHVLKLHGDSVYHVAFSHDGQRIVTTSGDNQVCLWEVNSGKLLHLFEGHKKAVVYAAFSPNDRYLVTTSMDNTARLWQVDNGKLIQVLEGHQEGVFQGTFSPDGQSLVTVGGGGGVRLWEISGELLKVFEGHESGVFHAAFSPDGLKLVTASLDKTARLWDVSNAKLLKIFEGHKNGVYHAAFSPNGQRVVTASFDNTARLWQVKSGKLFQILEGHENGVSIAAFSPSGQQVLTASWDNTARLWDVASGKRLRMLKGHLGRIYYASFSPNGQYVITVSEDKTARLWDTQSGKLINIFKGHKKSIFHAAFSPDSQAVVTASMDNTARLWKMSGDELFKVLKGHKKPVTQVAFSQSGEYLVTASKDKTARLWEVSTGKLKEVLEGHKASVYHATFSPDSQRVVTTSWDHTARLWEVKSGKLLHVLDGHNSVVRNAEFSPDGQYVVTASEDNTARLWSVSNGKTIHVLKGHEKTVRSVVFSPNSQYVLTVSRDHTARLWKVASGKILHVLEGHKDEVVYAAFSPDSQSVVTASSDKTARLWNVSSGIQLKVFKGHKKGLSYVAFTPSGKRIITTSWDRTAHLWDLFSDMPVKVFKGHQRGISHAALSPSGQHLVTTGKVARLLEISSGKLKGILEGHPNDWLYYTAFSPDGQRVVTASKDKTARLWPVFSNTQALIDYANQIVPRCLTSEQRHKFSLPTTESQRLMEQGKALARAGKIEKAVNLFKQAKKLEACFKFEPRNLVRQIAAQAQQTLTPLQTIYSQSSSGKKRPLFCFEEQEFDKSEHVICDNALLWKLENQNHKMYHQLKKSSHSDFQEQLEQELRLWLYTVRNPHCEQSVKFCLQAYEERIKVLEQYRLLGKSQ